MHVVHYTAASKPRGNDAFCVIGNVGGEAERCCHEVRFETRMRRNAFAAGPLWGSLQHSPRP